MWIINLSRLGAALRAFKEIIRKEDGNALFLILIAVALFAALSYAVTQSGRGSGDTNKEQAMIMAAQITQEAAVYQSAVTRMLLTGTNRTEIRFENAGTSFLCTAGAECFWAPEGGGMTIPNPPPGAFTAPPNPVFETFNGSVCHEPDAAVCTGFGISLAVAGLGTSAKDTFIKYSPLTESVCRAINKGLGISGIPGQNLFTPTIAIGKPAACIQINANYHYYHVLIEN